MTAIDTAPSRRRDELSAAVMLLTRIPLGRFGRDLPAEAFRRGVWAYPIVGAAIGAASGGVFLVAAALGLSPALDAIVALATGILLTGALHEDGLADTADGLGGGRTREAKLAILRDSRIGSYGAIALVLALAARIAALAAITPPIHAAAALVAAAALGRAAMLVPMLLLSPARPDGVAAGLGAVGRIPAGVALSLGLSAAILCLPGARCLAAVLGASLAALALTRLAQQHLGGFTGDILGATCVLAECAVLGRRIRLNGRLPPAFRRTQGGEPMKTPKPRKARRAPRSWS